MEFQPLEEKTADKIIGFIPTKGNGPIEVLCDNEVYFAKTSTFSSEPFTDMISEILGIYLARLWGLETAEPCLMIIPSEIIHAYLKENSIALPERYQTTYFDDVLFFATKRVENSSIIEKYYNDSLTLKDINKIKNKEDIIKIGILDCWLGNKDRRKASPNLLIANFKIIPIDFEACFAYNQQLKTLKPIHLDLDHTFSILNFGLARLVLTQFNKKKNEQLHNELKELIALSLTHLDAIFSFIPKSYGFSQKAKNNVKFVLSNEERNKRVLNSFISYIPNK